MADSNITKRALAAALKSLLAERSFAKVSVREICEACGMSRKSFYYHFKDKYELLNWIFETEFVARVQQTQGERNAWELLNDLCCYFYDNRDFYRRAFAVQGQNSFRDYFREVSGLMLQSEMERIFGQEENIAFYTGFYLDALTCAILNWLQSRQPQPPAEFCALLRRCVVDVSGHMLAAYRRRKTKSHEGGRAHWLQKVRFPGWYGPSVDRRGGIYPARGTLRRRRVPGTMQASSPTGACGTARLPFPGWVRAFRRS